MPDLVRNRLRKISHIQVPNRCIECLGKYQSVITVILVILVGVIVDRFGHASSRRVKLMFENQIRRKTAQTVIFSNNEDRRMLSCGFTQAKINKKIGINFLELGNDAVLEDVV